MVRSRELHTVTLSEPALSIAVDRHSLQAPGIVAQLFAIVTLYRDRVCLSICSRDAGILSGLDSQPLASLRVSDYIVRRVAPRILPVGSREVLPRMKHAHRVLNVCDLPRALHGAMDLAVDLAPRFIVGRDDERILRLAHILAGDLRDAFRAVADLMHPALV